MFQSVNLEELLKRLHILCYSLHNLFWRTIDTVGLRVELDWMHKNKNRTDLLAAGRKKFRKNKDNKGGNGKPSGKAGKSCLSSGLLDEETTEMLNVLGGYCGHVGAQLSLDVIEERSFEFKIDGMEKSIGCTVVDLSPGLDGGLIKLSRLAKILPILDEDEFKFLFMSREISPEKLRDANTMTVHQSAVHDALERLKEELYVASFTRDAFHLQLSEHQILIDEISMANASLNDVQGKNEVLAEEIGQCRCELLEVATERKGLTRTFTWQNLRNLVAPCRLKMKTLMGGLK